MEGNKVIHLECKTCSGPLSNIPPDKQEIVVMEMSEFELREKLDAWAKTMVNQFPKCEHCNGNLYITKIV